MSAPLRPVLIISLLLAWGALAQPAPTAIIVQVSGGRVYLTRAGAAGLEPIDAGCFARSAVIDRQLHVAREDGRLRSFSLASPPALVNELLVDGELRSVFLLGNQAWVEVAHAEARPLRQLPQPVSGAPPMASPEVRSAPVEVAPPLVAAAPPPTAAAAPVPNADDTVIGPARAGGVVVLSGSLRPMVPIGRLGVGIVADASLTWHATVPFAARLRLWPVAAVTTAQGASLGGSLDLFFDARFFAAGLGIGFGTSAGGGGLVLTQHLRLGAIEGLQFAAQTQLLATPLRSPKWGPFRDVTAQLAVLFYTHERYLTGWPYVALALSAATPNFLR